MACGLTPGQINKKINDLIDKKVRSYIKMIEHNFRLCYQIYHSENKIFQKKKTCTFHVKNIDFI